MHLRHLQIMNNSKIRSLKTMTNKFKQEEDLVRLVNKKNYILLSQMEPKTFLEPSKDEGWMRAMEKVLNQIEKNQTSKLVPRPVDRNVLETKWAFQSKLNEDAKVTRNKARMVYKCYLQIEGIDFEETFSLVSRIEAIRMFIAFATYKEFVVYQMDFKSILLNGELEDEVYIEQLDGFKFSKDPNMVYRLKKTLYGLKQAPKAWYARLDKYLL